MYGKTYKPHNSPGLAPAEALLVSLSPAFDGLHNNIKIFNVACSHWKLLRKQRPHGERERTIGKFVTWSNEAQAFKARQLWHFLF